MSAPMPHRNSYPLPHSTIAAEGNLLGSFSDEIHHFSHPAAMKCKTPMISLQNISVHFFHKDQLLEAAKNVSLEIPRGQVYGIVGTSGAGKSTILKTINLLQKPTSGRILIDGLDITDLKGNELRNIRLKMGMIFQHFNLMHNKTVAENIAFVMKIAGRSREHIKKRVPELLELVGLSDKETVYPSRLSGGQKQRVGIARAASFVMRRTNLGAGFGNNERHSGFAENH